jgi:ribosome maturation factor RimP
MTDQQQTVAQIRELIEPILRSRQVELVDLIYRFEGGRLVLKFLVDTAQGISLDELSHLNRAIGAVLDEHEPISGRYTLEVSSPGLDRPLKTVSDFERVIGRRVRVITSELVESQQEHTGELLNAGEEAIVLKLDSGQKRQIQRIFIAKAAQDVEL